MSQLRGLVARVTCFVDRKPGAATIPILPIDFLSPLKSSSAVGASGPQASLSRFSEEF